MGTYWAQMRVTYSTIVTVEADSEEEARAKLRSGDWVHEQQNEAVDWPDPKFVNKDT